jgi:putative ABC transport system substrate-binding protein
MRRREFIALLGGAAALWPLASHAQQQSERVRRVVMLVAGPTSDPEVQRRSKAFRDELEKLGWVEGRNIRVEDRWAAGDVQEAARLAVEVIDSAPDVIVAVGTPGTRALQQITSTIPIVFVSVSDPIRAGIVKSLAHPGGNITGFSNLEVSLGGKWLQILKEAVADLRRVGIIYFPGAQQISGAYIESVTAASAPLSVESIPLPAQDGNDFERVAASFAKERKCGLIFLPDIFSVSHRRLMIDLPVRHSLPAIYAFGYFAREGGFISYGVDTFDLYLRAAGYTDQLLRGARPAQLPVQLPTKFEFIINLKTAKALGLTVPPSLLARADEVIE